MCQQTILKILKKNQWQTATQIQKQQTIAQINSIRANLKKLLKHQMIQMRETRNERRTIVREYKLP